jgi:hypothetical protein
VELERGRAEVRLDAAAAGAVAGGRLRVTPWPAPQAD